jgi:hypothetical protein
MSRRQQLVLEAALLLEARLIWSDDLESIRPYLAEWLKKQSKKRKPKALAVNLSAALLDDFSNNLTVD